MERRSSDRPMLFVLVGDHTGNTTKKVNLVANAPIRDLTQALVTQMGFPQVDPSGQRVNYHLAVDNRQLTDNETLLSAGIREGTRIMLLPEPVAGGAD